MKRSLAEKQSRWMLVRPLKSSSSAHCVWGFTSREEAVSVKKRTAWAKGYKVMTEAAWEEAK